MTARITAAALALFVCVLIATPVSAESPQETFRKLDKNNDGKITRDEVPDNLKPLFDPADANHDGGISQEELATFAERIAAKAMGRFADAVKPDWDIPYAGTDKPRQRLDLYLPKHPKNDKPLPVVCFIHGGGWQAGDKRQGAIFVAPFAASGEYAAVSIGYRLTNEAIWPAQIYDCKAAIRFLRANAKKYNLDPDRIAVIGASAGGHLVALLGTSGGVKELEGDVGPNLKESSRVCCVVDLFGPTDFREFTGGNATADSALTHLFGGPIDGKKDAARSASPVIYVTKEAPPFMLIHGTKDPIVPFHQSELLEAALKKAGVEAELVAVEGGGHGGFPNNNELLEKMRKFLEKHVLHHEAATKK